MSGTQNLLALTRMIETLRTHADQKDPEVVAKLVDLESAVADIELKRRDVDRATHLASSPWVSAVLSPLLGAVVGVLVFFIQAEISQPNPDRQNAQHDAEIANAKAIAERDWNLKALTFFQEHSEILLGPPTPMQESLINTMVVVFPEEVTAPMFARVGATTAPPETVKRFNGVGAGLGLVGLSHPEGLSILVRVQGSASGDESSRDSASMLAAKGFRDAATAAGIPEAAVVIDHVTDATKFPQKTEVRYYHVVDSNDAKLVNQFLTQLGFESRLSGSTDRSDGHPLHTLHVYIR